MNNFFYLIILFSTIIIPLIFSFHHQNPFYKNYKYVLLAIFVVLCLFIPWDIWFTISNIWGFNKKYISGIFIKSLPIEEWLFFIIINYCALFIFHLVEINLKISKYMNLFSKIFLSIVFFLLLISNLYAIPSKIYTLVASSIGIVILIFLFFNENTFFNFSFILTFLIILIPFLVVNGILTGLFTLEPVVYYDDTKNLSIRFLTIPIEDFIYNFIMIFLATYTYYYSKCHYSKEVYDRTFMH